MSGIYYTQMADWLRSVGLVVVEVSGWQTRARSSGGFAATPLGVQWHHTASQTTPQNDTNWQYFNSDDRPIGNMTIMRDGSVWIGAAGGANTAGKGGPLTLSRGTIPQDGANSRTWAIEVANSGVGEVWPQVQIDAYFKASNEINRRFGNKPTDVFSHAIGKGNGWTDRKIDPATAAAVQGPWRPRSVNSSGTWDLDDIRSECTKRAGGSTPPPNPPSGGTTYIVQAGDSWYGIANKFHVDVNDLLAANGATTSTVIHPGDLITIPGGSTPPPVSGKYTVVAGDSWWGISQKLSCTLDALLAANPPATSSTVIHPGDVLNVPGSAPTPPPQDWVQTGKNSTTPPGSPTLKKGVVHPNVTWLQAVLCSMNQADGNPYYNPAWVDHDSVGTGPDTVQLFGDASFSGVKVWQQNHGLTADGVYGTQTANKMAQVRGK